MTTKNVPVSALSGLELDRAVAGLSADSLPVELVPIAATFEHRQDEWHYRFNVRKDGETVVFRAPADNPLWGHGVLKQVFDRSAGSFVPSIRGSLSVSFKSLEEAVATCLPKPAPRASGPLL